MQDVIPMLAYENGIAALEWLKQAFGFESLFFLQQFYQQSFSQLF